MKSIYTRLSREIFDQIYLKKRLHISVKNFSKPRSCSLETALTNQQIYLQKHHISKLPKVSKFIFCPFCVRSERERRQRAKEEAASTRRVISDSLVLLQFLPFGGRETRIRLKNNLCIASIGLGKKE